MKEIFKERLGFLYSQIVFTKLEFKILNDFITRENNIKYPEFMLVIFEGMKTSLLMKLAKILEQDSKNDSISIYYIFNTILSCGDINRKNKELTKYIYEKREELEDLYNKNQAIEDTIYRKNYDIDNDDNLDLIEVIVKMNVKYVSELPVGHQYGVVGYDGGIDECIIKINGTTKSLGTMNPIENIEIIKENDMSKLKIEASYRANENTYYIGYNSNEIKVEIKVEIK